MLVHVAQGDDVFAEHVLEVGGRLSAGPDRGQVQLAAGRRMAGAAKHVGGTR